MVHQRLYLEVRGTCQETGGPREAVLLTREAQELMERLSGDSPKLVDRDVPIIKAILLIRWYLLLSMNAGVLLDSYRQIHQRCK